MVRNDGWASGAVTRLVDSGVNYEGFYPYVWAPFYAPPGVSSVLVLVHVGMSRDVVGGFRVTTQDSSLNLIDQVTGLDAVLSSSTPGDPGHWLDHGVGGHFTMAFTCAVTPGAVNLLKLEAWDGYYDHNGGALSLTGSRQPDRIVYGWSVLPVLTPPRQVPVHIPPDIADNDSVKVPSAFTPFDSALVANNRAISSHLLVNAMKNDALLWEVATGKPAGQRGTATYTGHTHKGDTSLNSGGAELSQTLGSWAYGTLRAPPGGGGAHHLRVDEPWNGGFSADDGWSAFTAYQINASAATNGAWYAAAYHRVRIPAALSASLADGTGKLKAAALIYDNGVTTGVRVTMGDKTTGSLDTPRYAEAAGTGRSVVTMSGVACTRPELINSVRVQIRTMDNTKAKAAALYGLCIYFEA
jgi:hypothetical protein